MKKYKYELAISIIGAILSVIELFLNINFGIFILSVTIIMDLALLGMRFLITENLNKNNELYKNIYDIKDTYWRDEALSKYESLRQELNEMAKGQRKVGSNMITAEELRIINQSKKSIYCTYFADNMIKLEMRLNTNAKQNPMYAINTSYKNIKSKKIDKKRIFILDRVSLEDDEVKKVLNELYEYYSSLNFQTKFLLFSKMKEVGIPYIGNMILVDNTECTICKDNTRYPDEYIKKDCNLIRELECNNIVNSSIINEYKNVFRRMWELAVGIGEILT